MDVRVIDIGGSGVKSSVFTRVHKEILPSRVLHFSNPNWGNFESWLSDNISNDCPLIGVSCAGFVDSQNGIVKMFRVGGWTDKKLKDGIAKSIGGKRIFVINDGEAHLYAHNDMYAHPQISISLGTSFGFAMSDANGHVSRPPDNINYDLGEIALPTRASNNRCWWALGSNGLTELQTDLGKQAGLIQFGYRLGSFTRSICSIFRPKTVVFSGWIPAEYWHILEAPLKDEFGHDKPDWLHMPEFKISPFGKDAAFWGVAKYVIHHL